MIMLGKPLSSFLGVAFTLIFSMQIYAADIDTVKARLASELLKRIEATNAEVAGLLSTLATNGRWPDIDYADTSRTNWKLLGHVDRMLTLAVVYNANGHTYQGSPEVQAAYLAAFDSWVANLPTSNNWWYNQFGGPYQLVRGMVLMESALPAGRINAARSVMGAAGALAIGSPPNVPGTGVVTGQNLVWYYGIRIHRGCVENDAGLVGEGFTKIQDEVFISTSEGIRQDYSFMQHGPLLKSVGYGADFGRDIANFVFASASTSFAFSSQKIDLLSAFLLDHFQWTLLHKITHFGVVGRAISRVKGLRGGLSASLAICDDMIAAKVPRAAEFVAFRERLNASTPSFMEGNRHFWRADILMHQRPGYYSSVHMHSKRTIATESLNGENLQGYHLGNGVFIYGTRGDEYLDIFPVWDWRRLPGVSSRQTATALPSSGFKGFGATDFVGGVSNGRVGVAACDQNRDHVTGKKSWFFLEDEVVALGVGIKEAGGLPVYTSVNQALWRTDVCLPGGVVAERGQRSLTVPTWVHQDSIGYVFPEVGTNLTLKAEAQSGSWQAIDSAASDATVTKDVFSLWLDHGTATGSYAYVVVPAKPAADMATYAAKLPVRTLVNSQSCKQLRISPAALRARPFFRREFLMWGPVSLFG
jgi:chondroitin AC lyase